MDFNTTNSNIIFFNTTYCNKTNFKETIYHYTGIEGLMGIIGGNKLRFTCLNCFDDKQEYRYVYKLILNNILKTHEQRLKENKLYDFLKSRCQNIINSDVYYKNEAFLYSNYFVVCFSDINSKEMWKEYSFKQNVTGYQLQCYTSDLKGELYKLNNYREHNFLVAKVCYQQDEQLAILNDIFDKYIYLNTKKNKNRSIEYRLLMDNIIICCLFFKSPQYCYEQETRFIIKLTEKSRNKYPVQFVQKKQYISMFVELPLNDINLFKKITVFPANNKHYIEYCIRNLSTQCRYLNKIEFLDDKFFNQNIQSTPF